MAYIVLMSVIVGIDQLVKYLVRCNMAVGESISVLGDFFRLTHYENDGAAFSSLSGQRVILILIPVIAIIAGLIYMFTHRKSHMLLKISLSLIMAGGAGNLIDRIAWGKVTDMFDFSIFPPIFNVADICVVAGCGLLIVYIFIYDRLEKSDDGNR